MRDFKSNDFVSADCKGFADAFFVSADCKGLAAVGLSESVTEKEPSLASVGLGQNMVYESLDETRQSVTMQESLPASQTDGGLLSESLASAKHLAGFAPQVTAAVLVVNEKLSCDKRKCAKRAFEEMRDTGGAKKNTESMRKGLSQGWRR